MTTLTTDKKVYNKTICTYKAFCSKNLGIQDNQTVINIEIFHINYIRGIFYIKYVSYIFSLAHFLRTIPRSSNQFPN